MNLDPFFDWKLSDGAARLLVLLPSMAGTSRMVTTLTWSLATRLERCRHTIRNYFCDLRDAGRLDWQSEQLTSLASAGSTNASAGGSDVDGDLGAHRVDSHARTAVGIPRRLLPSGAIQ
jgi:hypothetical protein